MRELKARSGQIPTSSGIGERAAEAVEERVEVLEVEEHLRHRELRSGLELALEAVELELEVVGRRVDGDAA